MIVRRERPADVPTVATIHRDAFARPDDPEEEPLEVGLLAALRDDEGWIPTLSLVATHPSRPDEVLGHVVCTRGWVDDAAVVGLGPIAVRPDHQGQGIGSALIDAVLGAAEALDVPLVGLLGDPHFYGRFGFVMSTEVGVESPDPTWGVHFQVRILNGSGHPTGRFRYAAPFDDL